MLERRNLILCAFALTVLFSCSPADGLFGQNFAASSGGKEKKWLLPMRPWRKCMQQLHVLACSRLNL